MSVVHNDLTNAAPDGALCVRFLSGEQPYLSLYQPPVRSTAAGELGRWADTWLLVTPRMTISFTAAARRALVSALLTCYLGACMPHLLGDESEWLGETIGEAAARHRTATEFVVSYAPTSGVNQRYSVEVSPSAWCSTMPCAGRYGSLTVRVERGRQGSTTYHMRFIAVPKPLAIHKNGQATELVFRKNSVGVIELVELR